MYTVIDIKTGLFFGGFSPIPQLVIKLPPQNDSDGGTAHFSRVGQTEPAHAPRYRMVEVEEATPRPEYPVIEAVPADYRYDAKADKVIAKRTFAPDQAAFTTAIEDHIESVARERGYSSAVSCASYVSDPNPVWAADAQAFVTWRSAVWSEAFATLAEVQAGERPVPTITELIAELPAMEWPKA